MIFKHFIQSKISFKSDVDMYKNSLVYTFWKKHVNTKKLSQTVENHFHMLNSHQKAEVIDSNSPIRMPPNHVKAMSGRLGDHILSWDRGNDSRMTVKQNNL